HLLSGVDLLLGCLDLGLELPLRELATAGVVRLRTCPAVGLEAALVLEPLDLILGQFPEVRVVTDRVTQLAEVLLEPCAELSLGAAVHDRADLLLGQLLSGSSLERGLDLPRRLVVLSLVKDRHMDVVVVAVCPGVFPRLPRARTLASGDNLAVAYDVAYAG